MKDDLIEQLNNIAKATGIEKSALILDEARYFAKTHEGHGDHSIRLEYNGPTLETITVVCAASNMVDFTECPHSNEKTPPELGKSIVYSRNYVEELDIQKARREGRDYKELL